MVNEIMNWIKTLCFQMRQLITRGKGKHNFFSFSSASVTKYNVLIYDTFVLYNNINIVIAI